jgi:hypothetical protein
MNNQPLLYTTRLDIPEPIRRSAIAHLTLTKLSPQR